MEIRELPITGEFVTLGQFLKIAGFVDTGGEVKYFLMEQSVKINDAHDNRRGRKIYIGDVVAIEGQSPVCLVAAEAEFDVSDLSPLDR